MDSMAVATIEQVYRDGRGQAGRHGGRRKERGSRAWREGGGGRENGLEPFPMYVPIVYAV